MANFSFATLIIINCNIKLINYLALIRPPEYASVSLNSVPEKEVLSNNSLLGKEGFSQGSERAALILGYSVEFRGHSGYFISLTVLSLYIR